MLHDTYLWFSLCSTHSQKYSRTIEQLNYSADITETYVTDREKQQLGTESEHRPHVTDTSLAELKS